MSAAPTDVKVTINAPLVSSAPLSLPSPTALFLKSLLFLPFKLLGLTIFLTFELVLHILTFQWLKAIIFAFKTMGKRTVAKSGGEGEHHRVNPLFVANGNQCLTTPFEGVTTMYDLSKRSFDMYAGNNCMGTRKYIGQKTAKVKEFGETQVSL